jgi:hypothetical protein
MIISTPEANQIERIRVTITVDPQSRQLTISTPDIGLNAGKQELLWKVSGSYSGELLIKFASLENPRNRETPFRACTFRPPKGGGALSGSPALGKARTAPYNYKITLSTQNSGTTTVVGSVRVTTPPASVSEPGPNEFSTPATLQSKEKSETEATKDKIASLPTEGKNKTEKPDAKTKAKDAKPRAGEKKSKKTVISASDKANSKKTVKSKKAPISAKAKGKKAGTAAKAAKTGARGKAQGKKAAATKARKK